MPALPLLVHRDLSSSHLSLRLPASDETVTSFHPPTIDKRCQGEPFLACSRGFYDGDLHHSVNGLIPPMPYPMDQPDLTPSPDSSLSIIATSTPLPSNTDPITSPSSADASPSLSYGDFGTLTQSLTAAPLPSSGTSFTTEVSSQSLPSSSHTRHSSAHTRHSSDPSPTGSPATPNNALASTSHTPTGTIVGGVLGTLIFLFLLVAALFFWWRRIRRNRTAPSAEFMIVPHTGGMAVPRPSFASRTTSPAASRMASPAEMPSVFEENPFIVHAKEKEPTVM